MSFFQYINCCVQPSTHGCEHAFNALQHGLHCVHGVYTLEGTLLSECIELALNTAANAHTYLPSFWAASTDCFNGSIV